MLWLICDFDILTAHCFTSLRVMGPKHAHSKSVDPDQISPRGLRREKKLCKFVK